MLLQFFSFPVDLFISFIEPKADVQTLDLFENLWCVLPTHICFIY